MNFSCHATVLGPDWNEVSADFPGVACTAVQNLVGGTATYLQGFAGDINPARAGTGWAECERIGGILGASVATAVLQGQGQFAGLRTESPTHQREFETASASGWVELRPRLAVNWVSVPVQPERGRSIAPAAGSRTTAVVEAEKWITDLLRAEPNLFGMVDPGPPSTIRIQAVTLADDLHVVGIPGEPFGATAGRLRATAPGMLMTAGYANQSVGYLPPADDWDLGGYEVGCCGYASDTESRLTSAAMALLGEQRS
jgi:hypothetical protein